MSCYVTSDIHGEYDKFMKLLQKLQLKDEDTLYINGDILDRGPHPVKTFLEIQQMPNAVCLLGNHEYMAYRCLKFMSAEITDELLSRIDENVLGRLTEWRMNGAGTTIDEFSKLDRDTQQQVLASMEEFLAYEELNAGGKNYLIVHGGLGNFYPGKQMEDYTLNELIWERPDYEKRYFKDCYLVTGHTPTQLIECNPEPGYIYRQHGHIAIDCGCTFEGGRLAAICLDTGEEYYV